jgi:hypothetical protein
MSHSRRRIPSRIVHLLTGIEKKHHWRSTRPDYGYVETKIRRRKDGLISRQISRERSIAQMTRRSEDTFPHLSHEEERERPAERGKDFSANDFSERCRTKRSDPRIPAGLYFPRRDADSGHLPRDENGFGEISDVIARPRSLLAKSVSKTPRAILAGGQRVPASCSKCARATRSLGI